MMCSRRIIGFFSMEHALENEKSAYDSIDAILRLWSSEYTKVTSLVELEHTLALAQKAQERCILIINCLSEPLVALVHAHAPLCETMLISNEQTEFHLEAENIPTNFNHYLSLQHGPLSKSALICAIKKIMTQEIFGLDKYVQYGTPVFKYSLTSSQNRSWFLDQLQEYITNLKGLLPHSGIELGRLSSEVLDELMMNAIWDANPRLAHTNRSVPVSMLPHESVNVGWACDGVVLALGVCDPFGTLGRTRMASYIPTLFDKSPRRTVSVKFNSPGAGIGIHMIFRRVSGLIVNVNPGIATEFIALFDATKSPKYLMKGTKIFHYFSV